jgi:hypothetical protein
VNPNSLPCTESNTSTSIKNSQVDQEISVPSDLPQLSPQRFQSLPDLTPISIRPTLNQNLTRRTNRKVSFSPVMATPSTINRYLRQKVYRRVRPSCNGWSQHSTRHSSGLITSPGINAKTHTAAIPTKSNTGYNPCPTPTISQTPSTNSFQPSANLVTPILTSTRQLGAASATGFQFMGSAIPPSGINPSQTPLRPPFSHSTTRISQPILTSVTQNVTTNTGQSLNTNTNPNLPTTQPTNNNSNQGNIISSTPILVKNTLPNMHISQPANKCSNQGNIINNTPILVKNNPSSNLPSQQTINSQLCSSYMLIPEEKAIKIKQGQAMQAMISVSIFGDRETSGPFDDWIAHLESSNYYVQN